MASERIDETTDEVYERPALSDYGTIEAWTKGTLAQPIVISIVI